MRRKYATHLYTERAVAGQDRVPDSRSAAQQKHSSIVAAEKMIKGVATLQLRGGCGERLAHQGTWTVQSSV